MFSRFSEEAQKVLLLAKKEMMELKHPYVGSEHLFLAILKECEEISLKFEEMGVSYKRFKEELVRVIGIGKEENSWFIYTPLLKRILENAAVTSREVNAMEVNVYHLVIAMIEEGDGVALRLLAQMDVDIDDIYEEFSAKLVDKKGKQKRKLLVEEFGVDLTKKASRGEIDPVIGREKEVLRMIEILSRRCKNNPLLVGEAGVGKTAVVEELARRIAKEEVPLSLKGKRIIAVEIASLVAGTKYRGEFEERVHKILKEIEARDDVIIFIDEVHTLVGAGGAEGAIDASNILKPALARGNLKLIGATTLEEYKKTIEEDKAFDRRFQKLEILEPTPEKTYEILLELKPLYCSFHGVKMEDNLLKEIVRLTDLYMYNRKQPDKSIDILDEVCSKVQLQMNPKNEKILLLKKELTTLEEKKQECIQKQDFQEALRMKEREKEILSILNTDSLKVSQNKIKTVHLEDIREVVVNKTKIPIFDLDEKGLRQLSKMESAFQKKIVGQKKAVHQLLELTKRIKFGLQKQGKPSSFLFVGPTGVGKTMLVKEYAKFLVGEENLIRMDMSEYRESHSISKIIGSPSGYVGYNDGKNVLEQIRNHPYAVLLLDEIEKAHPAVLNLFLQALDEGFMRDATSRKVRFDHITIIMTSNIGFGKNEIGFCKDTSSVHSKLKEFLSIEFINRIDEVLVFESLKEEDIRKILENKLQEVRKKFLERGIHLQLRKSVLDEIIEMSNYQEFGARKLDHILSQKVDSLVIQEILLGKKNVSIQTLKAM